MTNSTYVHYSDNPDSVGVPKDSTGTAIMAELVREVSDIAPDLIPDLTPPPNVAVILSPIAVLGKAEATDLAIETTIGCVLRKVISDE